MSYETGPHDPHEQARIVANAFRKSLDGLHLKIQNVARNSIMENVASYFPGEVAELEELALMLSGQPVRGGLSTAEYFVYEAEGVPFVKARLAHHKNKTNDFAGVFGRVAEIPTSRMGQKKGRLCIQLEPLHELNDRSLGEFYEQRGRIHELHHPFGVEEYTDQPIWVAVDSIQIGTFDLIGTDQLY